MGTGKPRISTAAAEPAGRVVQVELAPGRVLAELELGQVAELELVIGLAVVPELVTARVAALELVIDPGVAQELETARVVAPELVIGPAVVR
jgi:predicted RNA methylase